MSADNWTKCPKCVASAISKWKAKCSSLEQSYGKMSASEYMSKHLELQSAPCFEDTLREDYEQGINDGVYSVSYSGSCAACGFEYQHNFSESVHAPLENKEVNSNNS